MSLDWQEELAEEDKRQEIIDSFFPNWDNLTYEQQDSILEQALEKWREERDCL